MKKSKIMILLLVVAMVLTLSAVSAADTNDTSDSVVQAVDEAPIEEVASDDVDAVAATDDTTVLSTGEKNFTQLQTDVSGGTVLMSNDYVRQTGENTISITNDVTILGNGYKIDGSNLGGIFNVNSGCTLTLMGVTLINGNATNGGAIYNNGGTLTIVNSYFLNNTATNRGGAIYNNGGSVTVTGSTFTGNKVSDTTNGMGGAIFAEPNSECNITGTTFIGNVDRYPAAIIGPVENLGFLCPKVVESPAVGPLIIPQGQEQFFLKSSRRLVHDFKTVVRRLEIEDELSVVPISLPYLANIDQSALSEPQEPDAAQRIGRTIAAALDFVLDYARRVGMGNGIVDSMRRPDIFPVYAQLHRKIVFIIL